MTRLARSLQPNDRTYSHIRYDERAGSIFYTCLGLYENKLVVSRSSKGSVNTGAEPSERTKYREVVLRPVK